MEVKPVIIFGAKTIGKIALEIFKSNDVTVYGFLEDDKLLHQGEIDFVGILGSTDDDGFLKLIGQKCDAFIASDELKYHKHLVQLLQDRRHIVPTNAIHYQTWLATTVSLGHGNLIDAGASLGTFTKIGSHNLIHAQATLDAEVELGDYIQIGAGSTIGSNVIIEDGAFIGTGVTIVNGITIGKHARVGAGSVVIENVKPNTTVFGNPAKAV
jgi:sugar O-acyltransferase (sialic acid O-acetyltransferase NeuD family)